MAQSVEHILGKDEVGSSSLLSSSTRRHKARIEGRQMKICLPFLLRLRLLFRANTTVLREAEVMIYCALRETQTHPRKPQLTLRHSLSSFAKIFRRVLAELRTLRGVVMSVSEM